MDVDSRKDIAFLKIKAIDLKVLRVGSSSTAQVGDTVYSLSNPLGLPRTLSQGIISGIRQLDGYQLLQITAPISPGSSGGPLFNTKGEVIGITAAALEGGQSLNFAIPIDYARGMILSPSDPRPPASVYNPERPAGPVDGPVDANPSPDAGRELRIWATSRVSSGQPSSCCPPDQGAAKQVEGIKVHCLGRRQCHDAD